MSSPEPAQLATDLRTVLGRLVRRLREEPREVSLSQGAVLGRLDDKGALGISELATVEHVRPQSMAATVSALEAEGWVDRSPDAQDGRRQLISLTAAGRAVLESDRRRRAGWLAGVIEAELSAAERRRLAEATQLMARLTD